MRRGLALVATVCFVLGAIGASAQTRADNDASAKREGWRVIGTQFWAPTHFRKIVTTPSVPWSTLSGEMPLPNRGGGFQVRYSKWQLKLDTTGDGSFDSMATGQKTRRVYHLTYPDGVRQPYKVMIAGNRGIWTYRSNGGRMARLDGYRILLIDANNNGIFNEYGTDHLVVSRRGMHASLLSKVVNIKNKLYHFKADAAGTRIYLKPWVGETGKIDLHSLYKAHGRLAAAVVSSGELSFNVVEMMPRPFVLPAGDYTFTYGLLRGRGEYRVRISSGKSFPVASGREIAFKWGAPFNIDFSYNHANGVLNIDPSAVTVGGSGGETYGPFRPHSFTPTVLVRNKGNGRMIKKGTMCLG